jgi:hypothetical protein
MIALLIFLFRLLVLPSKPEHRLDAENVALRAADHPATQAARSRAAHERRPAIGAAKKDYERAICRDEEDSARRKFFGVRALPDLAKFVRLTVDVELKMADLEGCDVVAAMFSKDAPDPAQIFADNKGPAVSAFELLPWALRSSPLQTRELAGSPTWNVRYRPRRRSANQEWGPRPPDRRTRTAICDQRPRSAGSNQCGASRRSTIPAQGETAPFSTALGAPVPIAHQEHGRGHAVAAVIEQARDGASV